MNNAGSPDFGALFPVIFPKGFEKDRPPVIGGPIHLKRYLGREGQESSRMRFSMSSCLLWAAMQRVAMGRASRRLMPISSSVSSQYP